MISLVAGLVFSPHATNLLRPEEYAQHSVETLDTITLYFARLVLGVQLVLAGVQLPSKYLKTEWKSLSLLLGPVMTIMWIITSLLVFAFVPHISFLQALAVGACVTPTDPVLSNSIVKGKFADKNIPKELQKIIVAESGANDGLGYPFLFLPLYLIQHIGHGGLGQDNSVRNAIGMWFGETMGYTILLSILYGAAVGWIAKELLHWAEEKKYVDRESFLVFAITLAVSTLLSPDDTFIVLTRIQKALHRWHCRDDRKRRRLSMFYCWEHFHMGVRIPYSQTLPLPPRSRKNWKTPETRCCILRVFRQ